jgi:hypothetical protein
MRSPAPRGLIEMSSTSPALFPARQVPAAAMSRALIEKRPEKEASKKLRCDCQSRNRGATFY